MEANNAAAMREALEAALPIMRHCPFTHYNTTEVDAVVSKMEAALALPRRQCDVGTTEEQCNRHNMYCNSQPKCRKCLREDAASMCISCFAKWAQMPYTEREETNGSK